MVASCLLTGRNYGFRNANVNTEIVTSSQADLLSPVIHSLYLLLC